MSILRLAFRRASAHLDAVWDADPDTFIEAWDHFISASEALAASLRSTP